MSEIFFPMDKSADAWRAMAGRNVQEAHDSFERCDTDGFMSQWASGVMANVYLACAKVAENDGKAELPWVFDADGNPIEDWRWIEGKYGSSVKIGAGRTGLFWRPSSARNGERRRNADLAKGYQWGVVETEVVIGMAGNRVNVYPVRMRKQGSPLRVVSVGQYEDQ